MNRQILFLVLYAFGMKSFSQSEPHADLLRSDYYMEHALTIDCDNTTGSNPEHAICLFKELMSAETEMQALVDTLANSISSTEVNSQFVSEQTLWRERTVLESLLVANESSGYFRDILILDHRLKATQFRVIELQNIVSNR